jgi:hypothetical protein
MKKLIVLILLMVSTSVFAEWTIVGGNFDGGHIIYADFVSIKKKGNKVKMLDLSDFKTVRTEVGGQRYLSVIQHNEYDCLEETKRLLDYYMYSGNMRGGVIVSSDTNIKMETISVLPESMDDTLFKIACGNK